MSKVYTFFYKLEKKFPSMIFDMDYSKINKVGKITARNRNKLQDKKVFEIHYFEIGKPISVFDDETGKKVNIIKELNNFEAYIRMSRNIDIILNI